jgi:hypothetical protein
MLADFKIVSERGLTARDFAVAWREGPAKYS